MAYLHSGLSIIKLLKMKLSGKWIHKSIIILTKVVQTQKDK